MIDLHAYRPLLPRLACPDCRGGLLERAGDIICTACERTFTLSANGVLPLMPLNPKPEPPIYDDPDFKKYRALYDSDAENVYYSNQNALFHWIHHSAHQRTHRYWTEWAQPGWVADIGCGTGDHFSYFADLSRVREVLCRPAGGRRCGVEPRAATEHEPEILEEVRDRLRPGDADRALQHRAGGHERVRASVRVAPAAVFSNGRAAERATQPHAVRGARKAWRRGSGGA